MCNEKKMGSTSCTIFDDKSRESHHSNSTGCSESEVYFYPIKNVRCNNTCSLRLTHATSTFNRLSKYGNRGVYFFPTRVLPVNVSMISKAFSFCCFSVYKHPLPTTRLFMRMYCVSLATSLTRQYTIEGFTHSARLLGNVHGVVVHARNDTFSSSTMGKFTIHLYRAASNWVRWCLKSTRRLCVSHYWWVRFENHHAQLWTAANWIQNVCFHTRRVNLKTRSPYGSHSSCRSKDTVEYTWPRKTTHPHLLRLNDLPAFLHERICSYSAFRILNGCNLHRRLQKRVTYA